MEKRDDGQTPAETSVERSGDTEGNRRHDGAGRNEPVPGGEESRGNVEPEVDAPVGAKEVWTPEDGTRKTDPAND